MSAAALYAMPRNLVLAASAGTGKTHALVGVVVHMLLGGRADGPVDASRIVATTFSRKAAAEIRARVVMEIERLVLEPSKSVYAPTLREAITDAGGRNTSDNELTKRAKKALARLPQARFGTLHSFATGLVQRYAVELGLGPGFELANEAESRARIEDAIAHALERRLEDSPIALRQLAEAAGGIDRLVASLRRVLNQLEEDGRSARDLEIDPSDARVIEGEMLKLVAHAKQIVSFPRCTDAANEMIKAWGRGSGDPDRVERAAAELTALKAVGSKPPEVEAFFVFRNDLPGLPNEEKGRRLARAWRARDAFATYGVLVRDVLAEAELEVERTGRVRAMLGFGEVLRGARELLRDRPDVAEEVGAGIDALLVDEFQDTSRVQRDLLQLLWARPDRRSKQAIIPPLSTLRPTGLLVVGDRKQSIYGFRGADVGVFAELAVGLAGTPAREALGIPAGVTWEPKEPIADFHALRHNRRSVGSILAFANAFSAKRFVPGDPPPELFEIDYVPRTEDLLLPPESRDSMPALPPEDETPLSSLLARSLSVPPSPPIDPVEKARIATTWLRVRPKGAQSTKLEEALVIAARIALLRKTPIEMGRGDERLMRVPECREMAVLATTNGMLDAVAFALAQSSIPYVVSGKSFFRAREISDLAAMLSVILDPTDRLALLELLRGPWASVHDETLLGLVEPGKGIVPPAQWVSAPPTPSLIRAEDQAALGALASLIEALGRCAPRLGAGAILREAVAMTGFESVLSAMPRGEQRVANVQKLLSMADRHPDARAFRKWLDDAKEQEVGESEAATFSDADDAVRLLTVHASKGLDFPIVFVPEIGAAIPRGEKGVARVALGPGEKRNVLSVRIADDTGFVLEPPSYTRGYENTRRRDRAERQRLAYVAITRAARWMFFVGGRAKDTPIDPGDKTIAALEQLSNRVLNIEDVDVPPMTKRDDTAFVLTQVARTPSANRNDASEDQSSGADDDVPDTSRSAGVTAAEQAEAHARLSAFGATSSSHLHLPAWTNLPIAPSALADFAHCARRFELVHLLGLPEHRKRKLNVLSAQRSRNALADRAFDMLDAGTDELAARSGAAPHDASSIAATDTGELLEDSPPSVSARAGKRTLDERRADARVEELRVGEPAALAAVDDPRTLDARAEGTVAHAILERLALEDFLDPDSAAHAARVILEHENVPEDHPQHVAIHTRAMRFLTTPYVRSLASAVDAGITITREVPFVLPIVEAEQAVTLRGSIDLVVEWPDGSVDIIDYKSARAGNAAAFGFQLDIYALAARALFPEASKLRAGLSFLGGGSGEPVWRDLPSEADVKSRIKTLASALIKARWTDAFPRAPFEHCKSIHCGFIGRCHPDRE